MVVERDVELLYVISLPTLNGPRIYPPAVPTTSKLYVDDEVLLLTIIPVEDIINLVPRTALDFVQ